MENLIIIFLFLFIVYKMFYSDIQENMETTHIPNMMSLQKFTNQKFPHYKKNQTYYDKIEKPHTDIDEYFSFNNYNKNEYQKNRLTTSEIENTYFFQKFNSSINNEKSIKKPNIDNFSESRYYVKNIRPDLNIYEDLYNKYSNEGVMNGGNFMENINGIQENYKSDLSKF
jgi:hypothetical protein